ncbi:MAG: hypothetical protein ACRD96_21460, partial [Bryobacteraceae bacterium]
DKDPVEASTREQFAFAPGGVVAIVDSFGVLSIEGWDRPDVEVWVTKKTRKEYTDPGKGVEELDRVVVTPVKESDARFVVTTEFPSRNLFTRPLRGKTNVELEYKIRVPRYSSLHIKHDIGEVRIKDVAGSINATARIGELSLTLPDGDYHIDARKRIGEVSSDFLSVPGATRQLYLRLGIGEINIRRMKPASPPHTD